MICTITTILKAPLRRHVGCIPGFPASRFACFGRIHPQLPQASARRQHSSPAGVIRTIMTILKSRPWRYLGAILGFQVLRFASSCRLYASAPTGQHATTAWSCDSVSSGGHHALAHFYSVAAALTALETIAAVLTDLEIET